MANKKDNRIRFSDIEKKYDVKMDYFSEIFFMIDKRYYSDAYIKTSDEAYIHVHRKSISRNKNDKIIKENKKFSSIKNKLSEYWAQGYEIDIDKTFVSGNEYREIYIIFK